MHPQLYRGQESVGLAVPNRTIFCFLSFPISGLALAGLFISPSSPRYEASSGHWHRVQRAAFCPVHHHASLQAPLGEPKPLPGLRSQHRKGQRFQRTGFGLPWAEPSLWQPALGHGVPRKLSRRKLVRPCASSDITTSGHRAEEEKSVVQESLCSLGGVSLGLSFRMLECDSHKIHTSSHETRYSCFITWQASLAMGSMATVAQAAYSSPLCHKKGHIWNLGYIQGHWSKRVCEYWSGLAGYFYIHCSVARQQLESQGLCESWLNTNWVSPHRKN